MVAQELDLSEGGLLKLAREVSKDGKLLSVNHILKADAKELLDFLMRCLVSGGTVNPPLDRRGLQAVRHRALMAS
jgi:hypothetical protein